MHRRLLLASCFVLPVALGALAQAEAERQLDAAIERLRTALGPDAARPRGLQGADPAAPGDVRRWPRRCIPAGIVADAGRIVVNSSGTFRVRHGMDGFATRDRHR